MCTSVTLAVAHQRRSQALGEVTPIMSSPGALVVRVKVRLVLAHPEEDRPDGGLSERPEHVGEEVGNVANPAADRVEIEMPAEVPPSFVLHQLRPEVDVVQNGRGHGEQVNADGNHRHRDTEDANRPRPANRGVIALECPGDGVQATEREHGPPEPRCRLWRYDHGVQPDRDEERVSLLMHIAMDAMVPILPQAGAC